MPKSHILRKTQTRIFVCRSFHSTDIQALAMHYFIGLYWKTRRLDLETYCAQYVKIIQYVTDKVNIRELYFSALPKSMQVAADADVEILKKSIQKSINRQEKRFSDRQYKMPDDAPATGFLSSILLFDASGRFALMYGDGVYSEKLQNMLLINIIDTGSSVDFLENLFDFCTVSLDPDWGVLTRKDLIDNLDWPVNEYWFGYKTYFKNELYDSFKHKVNVETAPFHNGATMRILSADLTSDQNSQIENIKKTRRLFQEKGIVRTN